MAECAFARHAAIGSRRVALVAGIAAASAPDVDLLYTGITQEPIGYLLHHRGHSHTWPGLVCLGLLIWLGLRRWPLARSVLAAQRLRLAVVIAAGLVSHLLMDASNSYGTHLFYPWSSRWFYGDAAFIFEPWGWLVLGTALALNAKRRLLRSAVILLTAGPIVALKLLGLISTPVVITLAAAGTIGAWLARSTEARTRAAAAVTSTASLFVLLFGLSRYAGAEVRRDVAASGRQAIDVVLNSNPATPWCWLVLTVERDGDTGGPDALLARRGALSLLPRLWPATTCALHRATAQAGDLHVGVSPALVWSQEWRIDVAAVRALEAADCRVRAWLQFARVPFVAGDRMVDLRFESRIGGGFASIPIARDASACPNNLTRWEPPRLDVLNP